MNFIKLIVHPSAVPTEKRVADITILQYILFYYDFLFSNNINAFI